MQNHSSRTAILLLLVGMSFLLSLHRLGVLVPPQSSEPHQKRGIARPTNRLRSTFIYCPRLAREESGCDGGRRCPPASIAISFPFSHNPLLMYTYFSPSVSDIKRANFPLRC